MTAKTFSSLVLVTVLALSSVSCGDFVRSQGRAPALIVINSLLGAKGSTPNEFGSPLVSDVETIVTTPEPCSTSSPCTTYFNDLGQVTMSLVAKDPGQTGVNTAPSALNQVTINRYRVVYRRSDGSVDVPAPIDSAVTFTVPAEGTVTAAFELVRNVAKQEAPLRALRTNGIVLSTIADVTFYGRDQAGNEVSATGSVGVNFGNFVP